MITNCEIQIGANGPKFIIPAPSSLLFLARGYVHLDMPVVYAIPDILLRLIEEAREGSSEHINFLARLVLEDHPHDEGLSPDLIISGLTKCIHNLQQREQLKIITDEELDPIISEALHESFIAQGYEISLSPKKNFMRDYFAKALSWSKKTGAVIIETTKRNLVHLGEYVVSLQLPKRSDAIVKDKQKFLNRIFSFTGGKTVRWILGISISVAGVAHPVFGAVGFGIAFIDP